MASNISCYKYSTEIIWQKAEEKLIKHFGKVLRSEKKVLLFLSGGSVVRLYGKIAQFLASETNLRQKITIAQVDERFKPQKDSKVDRKEINAESIGRTGLWDICSKKGIPYYIVSQEGSLKEAAFEYNKIVFNLFREHSYKMAILGVGVDAHTAGILPKFQEKWNKERYVVGYENTGRYTKRITLTPYGLRCLNYALVVAVGKDKKMALRAITKLQNKEKLDDYPGVILQEIEKVEIYTDDI